MRILNISAVLASVLLMTSCVFVQPTVEGKKVRVLTAGEVDRCRPLGNLTSTVTDHVGAIPRSQEAVQDDVTLNAQNAAAEMGGDTIVALDKMQNGRQTYGVYRCLAP